MGPGPMTWRESVASAINRLTKESGKVFSRHSLLSQEIGQMMEETGTEGLTPEQTISRVLQELRDSNQIEFLGQGEYRVIVPEVH